MRVTAPLPRHDDLRKRSRRAHQRRPDASLPRRRRQLRRHRGRVSRGVSEEIVGKALSGGRRDRVVLATKGRVPMGDDPNEGGAGRRYLVRAVEASLRRLRTDRIDLYQVHWPDPLTPLDETLSALDDMVRSGKVVHIGVSNFLGSHLGARSGAVRALRLVPRRVPSAAILPGQPGDRAGDAPVVCRSRGCRAALEPARGRHPHREVPFCGERRPRHPPGASEWQATRRLNEHNMRVADAVKQMAGETGRSAAQVALNWVLHRPGVTAPIIGALEHGAARGQPRSRRLGAGPGPSGGARQGQSGSASVPHDMYRMFGYSYS